MTSFFCLNQNWHGVGSSSERRKDILRNREDTLLLIYNNGKNGRSEVKVLSKSVWELMTMSITQKIKTFTHIQHEQLENLQFRNCLNCNAMSINQTITSRQTQSSLVRNSQNHHHQSKHSLKASCRDNKRQHKHASLVKIFSKSQSSIKTF